MKTLVQLHVGMNLKCFLGLRLTVFVGGLGILCLGQLTVADHVFYHVWCNFNPLKRRILTAYSVPGLGTTMTSHGLVEMHMSKLGIIVFMTRDLVHL